MSDNEESESPKKPTSSVKKTKKTTEETPKSFTISATKRVTINTFKGKKLVDIREFYTDKESGELKPGKKGISLSIEEFKKLLDQLPLVQDALKEA
jgi:hypothetical protein